MPIQLPATDKHSAVMLADWLELNAFAEGQCSVGDLNTALHAEGDGDDKVQEVLGAVQAEITLRRANTGKGYPFHDTNGSLTARPTAALSATYTHSLLLTYFGPSHAALKKSGVFPERMFEVVCREAARGLLTGDRVQAEAVRFGAPRSAGELPKSFIGAIDVLCDLLGEGGGFKAYEEMNASSGGDRGLDVVAWRELDTRPGRLVLFGACASGKDWDNKLAELNERFSLHWMQQGLEPAPLRAFFTTHVIEGRRWSNVARHAGLLMDRPRVASLVPRLPATTPHGDAREWVAMAAQLLREIARGAEKSPTW